MILLVRTHISSLFLLVIDFGFKKNNTHLLYYLINILSLLIYIKTLKKYAPSGNKIFVLCFKNCI